MFNEQEIKRAFESVKAVSDYPKLIGDLSELGAHEYVFVVKNGVNIFYGPEAHTITLAARYDMQDVNESASKLGLLEAMDLHRNKEIGFSEFCKKAADAGVQKWVSDLHKMTVSYLDVRDNPIYVQQIPNLVESAS